MDDTCMPSSDYLLGTSKERLITLLLGPVNQVTEQEKHLSINDQE